MLETLDSINWSQVTNCYGKSRHIPGAIRELLSEDALVREIALRALWGVLEHQGNVYEASALAVPFLLEILTDPQTLDKRQLVHLLAHLGSRGRYLGNWYQPLDTRLTFQHINEDKSPVSQEIREYYRRWEEDTHQAFREGLSIFLSLLSDPDSAIRTESAFLLATFPEDRAKLLPTLIAQLQTEKDEYVQCSLLLCLGHVLTPTLDASRLLQHYLAEGKTKLLQFTAARALCILLKEETPEEVVHVLLEVLAHPFPLQPSYEQLSPLWGSGWIHAKALYYLDQLMSSPHQTFILERLVELFPALEEHIDLDCADLLARVLFYEKNFLIEPDTTFDDLDPMQQAVLRAFVAKETLWPEIPSYEDEFFQSWDEIHLVQINVPPSTSLPVLEYSGLPTTRQNLQTFIATATRQ